MRFAAVHICLTVLMTAATGQEPGQDWLRSPEATAAYINQFHTDGKMLKAMKADQKGRGNVARLRAEWISAGKEAEGETVSWPMVVARMYDTRGFALRKKPSMGGKLPLTVNAQDIGIEVYQDDQTQKMEPWMKNLKAGDVVMMTGQIERLDISTATVTMERGIKITRVGKNLTQVAPKK